VGLYFKVSANGSSKAKMTRLILPGASFGRISKAALLGSGIAHSLVVTAPLLAFLQPPICFYTMYEGYILNLR
jgi:hypothetical protein